MPTIEIMKMTVIGLEKRWGFRPIIILACAGYADEHWQIYHPDEYVAEAILFLEKDGIGPMPRVTIDIEGHVAYHN